MPTDGTYKAVVDRFEDSLAVVLLEDDDETIGEVVVERDRLPGDGRHAGAVVSVDLEDEEVVDITYEKRETANRSAQAKRRFDELSERPPATEDEPDGS